jgi:hypothetical protein
VICPKCGEDNSDNFRFCGLCGTLLEAWRPAGAHVPNLPLAPAEAPNVPKPAKPLEPMRLPNQPGAVYPHPDQPSADTLRDRAFSGLDSFFEPEKPKGGGGRIFLMVALLAALGGAGWWTYTNYLGATETRKPEAATAGSMDAPSEKAAVRPAIHDAAPAPVAESPQGTAPAIADTKTTESKAEDATTKTDAGADAGAKTPDKETKTVVQEPKVIAKAEVPKKVAPADMRVPKVEPKAKLPAPVVPDTGDAAFRKGEAYLYGRGVPENCDEAVKNLKAASAKSNAKARSAFGTMYATGHCVPRDLPTSYGWFALALRVDPNNQILEKDLSAVWNQMTPPERQMATRAKQ